MRVNASVHVYNLGAINKYKQLVFRAVGEDQDAYFRCKKSKMAAFELNQVKTIPGW